MTNHRHLFVICLGWLWLTMAILCLAVLGWPPLGWLGLTSLIIFLEQSKLFFLSCVFPLLFNPPGYHFISTGRLKPVYFLLPLLFLALFLPLTVLLASFSHVSWLMLFLQELFLFFYGLLVVFLVSADNHFTFNGLPRRISHFDLKRWYYLIFFLLFGAGPLFFYLRLELTGHSTDWLLTINPFWLTSHLDQSDIFSTGWWIQVMCAGLIILFFLTLNIKQRRFR